MRKILTLPLAIVLLMIVTILSPAYSADMPIKNRAISPAATEQLFGGFYLGPMIGYGWTNSDPSVDSTSTSGLSKPKYKKDQKAQNEALSNLASLPGSADSRSYGALIGGVVGYDWLLGNIGGAQGVVGLAADLAWSGIHGSVIKDGVQTTTDMKWIGTLTARTGVILGGHVLAFVEGGAAVARFETNITGVGAAPSGITLPAGSSGDTKWGWTVGGGLDAALSARWHAFLKVRYAQFTDQNTAVGGVVSNGTYAATANARDHVTMAMIGFTYRP